MACCGWKRGAARVKKHGEQDTSSRGWGRACNADAAAVSMCTAGITRTCWINGSTPHINNSANTFYMCSTESTDVDACACISSVRVAMSVPTNTCQVHVRRSCTHIGPAAPCPTRQCGSRRRPLTGHGKEYPNPSGRRPLGSDRLSAPLRCHRAAAEA